MVCSDHRNPPVATSYVWCAAPSVCPESQARDGRGGILMEEGEILTVLIDSSKRAKLEFSQCLRCIVQTLCAIKFCTACYIFPHTSCVSLTYIIAQISPLCDRTRNMIGTSIINCYSYIELYTS